MASRLRRSLLIEGRIVEHAQILVVSEHLEVLVHIRRLGQVILCLRIAVAELDAVLILLDVENLDLDNSSAAFGLSLLLLLLLFASSGCHLALLKRGLKLQGQLFIRDGGLHIFAR